MVARDDLDNLAPTRRFSSRVGHYAKYRPAYPRAVIDSLKNEMGLTPASVVADIGSGTGILSKLFLENGNVVYGVEPNSEMRQAGERLLGNWPNFRSVDGTAESTTLADGSVDAVAAAQAFHWFDQERAVAEFKRITRPKGFVALIWNVRRAADAGFMAEYDRIINDFGSEFAPSGQEVVAFEHLKKLFAGRLRKRCFDNFQDLDWEGIRGRLLSASYAPLEGQPGFEPMIAALRAAYDRHARDGRVRLEYDTEVYLGPLS